MSAYLMEGPEEAARLEAKTDEGETLRQLRLVGLEPGSIALDAGAGTGAVARRMAAEVGPSGRVVAVDASAERNDIGRRKAAEAGVENLSFVKGELDALPFPDSSFDFVWSRFVFEYLQEPDVVLRELVRVVRPGGKLVVGDLDGNGLFHYPLPNGVARGLEKMMAALTGRFDAFAGRKLFHRFRRAGLESIRVHLMPYHLYAGAISNEALRNWELKLAGLRPIGTEVLGASGYDQLTGELLRLLQDPDSFTYSVLVLVEGRKPRLASMASSSDETEAQRRK